MSARLEWANAQLSGVATNLYAIGPEEQQSGLHTGRCLSELIVPRMALHPVLLKCEALQVESLLQLPYVAPVSIECAVSLALSF